MNRLAVTLLGALLTACPGGEAPPPSETMDLSVIAPGPDLAAPPPPERAYDACVAFYTAVFGRFEVCGVGFYSIPVDNYARYLCTRVQQRVDGGTARYDKSKVNGCLKSLGETPCDTLSLLQAVSLEGCGFLTGTRPAGAGCFDEIECAGGSCNSAAACPGTCRVSVDVGQNCSVNSCKLGLQCDNTVTPPVCRKLPGPGEPCPANRCTLGLYCDGGTCKTPQATGPCLSGTECALGTRCVGAVPPGQKGQCLPYKKLREPCTDDAECASGLQCADGLCDTYPRAGGNCGKLPAHSRTIGCIESYCDAAAGMAGRCQARIAEGQFCDTSRSDQCVQDTNCVMNRCTRTACFAYR